MVKFKITTPELIQSICDEVGIQLKKNSKQEKFSKNQLVNIQMFIVEIKKTNTNLVKKIKELTTSGKVDKG